MKKKTIKNYFRTFLRLITSASGVFILGSLIGLCIFTLLFDIRVVDPTNINWIQNIQGDVAQHYLGWMYFRDAPWSFPNIGYIDSLAYPSGISIVYMDVIPMFAIIFKLFSFVLPETFQYLGLFTILSFMLQGAFAALIIRRFTPKTWLVLLGAILITATPIIISRSFAHTALTAHWLVLMSIYLLITFQQTSVSLKRQILLWSINLILAVLTHAYFVPMVGFIFALSIVLQFTTIKRAVILGSIPLASMLIFFGLIGGFSPGMATGGSAGLGLYSLNALGLIIPMGYSSYFNSTFSQVSWEGLAYAGFGVLILISIIAFLVIGNFQNGLKDISKLWKKQNKAKIIIAGFGFFVLFVAALSPTIFIGNVNFNLPTPHIIDKVWSVFRSTGRLFWPIYYLLIIGSFAYIISATKKWNWLPILLLLVPLVFLQTTDILLSNEARMKHNKVESALSQRQTNKLNTAFIEKFCDKNMVVLVDNSLDSGIKMFEDLSPYIIACKPDLTAGYFARFPKNSILGYADKQRKSLVDGSLKLSVNDLYLSQSKDFINEIDSKYRSTKFGDYWVIEEKN